MIVARLLAIRVQPVYVLVDTETSDVSPGPPVQATEVPATQVDQLSMLIEQARRQVESQFVEQS